MQEVLPYAIYLSWPRYCPHTDALLGASYREVDRAQTLGGAHVAKLRWVRACGDDEVAVCAFYKGREVWTGTALAPAKPVEADAAEEIPF